MRLSDSFFTAIEGLKVNKGRSALTILGIVIGIAAVIGVMAVGQGAQSLVLQEIQGLGSNLIIITPGGSEQKEGRPSISMGVLSAKNLTLDDVEALSRKMNVPYAQEVMPVVMGSAIVTHEGQEKTANFIGSTSNLPQVHNRFTQEGRFFSDEEEKGMARVVVIGSKIKEQFFGEGNAIGERIKINRRSFEVIGVMEEQGVREMQDIDELIYVPISTAQKQLLGINYVNSIIVSVDSEEFIDQTISDIETTLRIRHNIPNSSNDDFTITTQKELSETIGIVTAIFTILLSCIAAISLLVGGIGIMNIMLVSVTERTKEIGLRKAVGARKKDILIQFLFESLLLTLIGGILGIIVGCLFSWGTSLVFKEILGSSWGFILPLNAVALGVGVSVIIGLGFGIYPAQKAAKLNPIEALRYE
ncbi:MAG: ABC transporter permease [Candidatus Pacebacteria bacterium]|nr:ABC transporter permease [Candidatus Paceibacterota bacterium]